MKRLKRHLRRAILTAAAFALAGGAFVWFSAMPSATYPEQRAIDAVVAGAQAAALGLAAWAIVAALTWLFSEG